MRIYGMIAYEKTIHKIYNEMSLSMFNIKSTGITLLITL